MSSLQTCVNHETIKQYCSALGEVRTLVQWQGWAEDFYRCALEKEYKGLPDNWFEKLTKVLKLVEL